MSQVANRSQKIAGQTGVANRGMTGRRVVIVGAGFGGLHAALSLRKAPVEVTVIDRRNFHLFQPLLYQVATGGLSPGDIASPIRSILKHQQNTRVLLGEVSAVDTDRRLVQVDGDAIPYDSLIVASGAAHTYFGHDRWEQHAPGLKSIEDALRIRSHIFATFEAAEREHDPWQRQRLLTFVVVGAGPTGVELAGALGEIAHDTLRNDFRTIDPAAAHILLLEGGPRILAGFPASLAAKAERSLAKLGAVVRVNTRVTDISADGVSFSEGDTAGRIEAGTVLWAAGIRASALGAALVGARTELLDRSGRILVGPDLTLPGCPDVFVIGDLACYLHQGGRPLPGTAPTAISQGRYAARVITDRLQQRQSPPYRFRSQGMLATIGRASAVADLGRLRFSGFPAWVLWLFIHLMALVEFDNRLLVFTQWFWNYVTRNRGARLVTHEIQPWK